MAKPLVGAHVYIAGTGQWWAGEHFGAVVVDVREKDNTVKVRFTDGGYKRFGLEEYNKLVSQAKYTPELPEEWSVQRTMSSSDSHSTEMKKMHDDIMEAVKQGDFLRAHELQQNFKSLTAKYDEIHALEVKLIDAVGKGDFKAAHDIQSKLKKLKGGDDVPTPKTVSAPGAQPAPTIGSILSVAASKALSGGMAGACAMVLQVSTLMWMRTTMNYQYRYGTSTLTALKTLYADGGIPRFYRGIGPALIQGPVSRFGDTAANAGVLALFENSAAKDWPAAAKTVFSSGTAATMRIALVPVDTVKTIMQVEGKEGLTKLGAKYRAHGVPVFFHGAIATSAATFVGHYPWFTVFNTLNELIPNYPERPKKLARNATIGFCASVCSDTVSNSLRVIKTYRQTNETLPYREIVKRVVEEDGVMGLMGRGLKTRILANGCQGIMFSVLYKLFEEKFVKK